MTSTHVGLQTAINFAMDRFLVWACPSCGRRYDYSDRERRRKLAVICLCCSSRAGHFAIFNPDHLLFGEPLPAIIETERDRYLKWFRSPLKLGVKL